jgi:8-oxo-dGTP diphosphatase
MDKKESRFMVSVGAMIECVPTGKILLLKRTPRADYSPGIWEDITGRMKQFEVPEEALKREVKEEAGLEIEIVRPLRVFHLFRGEKSAETELVGIIFLCRSQSDRVRISGEHTEYKWTTPSEALEMVDHPSIRKDIEAFIQQNKRDQTSR